MGFDNDLNTCPICRRGCDFCKAPARIRYSDEEGVKHYACAECESALHCDDPVRLDYCHSGRKG